MIVSAVAHLAAYADNERSPDHCHVPVDLDGRIADPLLKAIARFQALSELCPTLVAETAAAGSRSGRGHSTLRIYVAQHCRRIAGFKGSEHGVDRREDGCRVGDRRGQSRGWRQGLCRSRQKYRSEDSHRHHILKTPNCGRSGIGAFRQAANASPRTSRVCAGSMIPSSQSREVACQGLPCAS